MNERLRIYYNGSNTGRIELKDIDIEIEFGEIRIFPYSDKLKNSFANGDLLYYSTKNEKFEVPPLSVEKFPEYIQPQIMLVIKDNTK